MILVTGATGKVGGEAVRLLAGRGAPVRAFVRDAAKGRALSQGGAELAVGDFDDRSTLDAAVEGVDALVLASPGLPHQETAVIEAARSADVRHVVYLTSTASADSPIERRRWHHQVEQALAASGIPHTLLRANAFFQNTLMLAPVISRTGGFASSAAHGAMGLVDARDVAAVAAAVAGSPAVHAGTTYRLSGPEAITYDQVAAVLSEVLGRDVTYAPTTFDADRAAMIAAGVPERIATMNAQAFTLNASGDSDWVTGDVEAVTGSAPRSFSAFAAEHAGVFAR